MVKKITGLALAAAVMLSVFAWPGALAAEKSAVSEYTLSVDGTNVSLWAYETGGNAYFRLRDLAAALNGTSKQIEVSWDAEKMTVNIASGEAYTPVGGELSKPSDTGNAGAAYTGHSIHNPSGWNNMRAYLAGGSNYVLLSDFAAALKCASACDTAKKTAELDLSPDGSVPAGTGAAFDNIAAAGAGGRAYTDENGNVTIYYADSGTAVKAPVALLPSGGGNDEQQSVDEAGFYISGEKTAIVCGGADGDPVYVLTSGDMGKTWETSGAVIRNVVVSKLYVGFNTAADGWLVVSGGVAMGSQFNYIYRTADGGKTWTQLPNANDVYPRVLTGAGFSAAGTGFLSFRYETEFQPAILWTDDGGCTWEKLAVTLPEAYAGYNKTPLSPVFSGAKGLYPIGLSDSNGDYAMVYLTSGDYGRTWTYDAVYSLADRWARAVGMRDGRAQYASMGAELQAKYLPYFTACNWVTGVSSPWVQSYRIETTESGATVVFSWATSGGPAGQTLAALAFSEEGGTPVISALKGFEEHYGYLVPETSP